MNPEDRVLLQRALKLSEENNKILRSLQRTARWTYVWGFIKIAIVIVPLVAGYLYLQPFLEQAVANYESLKDVLQIQ